MVIALVGVFLLLKTRDGSSCGHSFYHGWTTPALLALAGFHTYAGWMALSPPNTYDSGLYYFQAIQWINKYPVVPGLANLNIQLGFNNLPFLWSALLNVFPLHQHGYLIWNSFVFVVAITPVYRTLFTWLRYGGSLGMLGVFRMVCLPAFLVFLHDSNYLSPSADFHSWILTFVLFDRCVVVFDALNRHRSLPRHSICLVLVLAPLLLTVKLSMLVFCGSMAAAFLLVLAARKPPREHARLWRGSMLCAMCAGAGILGPWILANVIMTGYPLYPAGPAITSANWRIPKPKVEAITQFITEFPRMQDPTVKPEREQLMREFSSILTAEPKPAVVRDMLETWNSPRVEHWKSLWWLNAMSKRPFRSLVRLCVVMGLVLAVPFIRKRMSAEGILHVFMFLAPLAASCIFWWVKAPALRFSLGYMFLAPIWLFTCLMCFTHRNNPWSGWISACVSLGLCALILWPAEHPLDVHTLPEIPRVEWVQVSNQHGVEIHQAVDDDRVYNTPLPAAPRVNPYLRMRNPEEGLSSGFTQLDDTASTPRF